MQEERSGDGNCGRADCICRGTKELRLWRFCVVRKNDTVWAKRVCHSYGRFQQNLQNLSSSCPPKPQSALPQFPSPLRSSVRPISIHSLKKRGPQTLKFEVRLMPNYSATGITETCFLSLPFLWNLTTPSTVANRVSSLPRPTFTPGWILVPRCL